MKEKNKREKFKFLIDISKMQKDINLKNLLKRNINENNKTSTRKTISTSSSINKIKITNKSPHNQTARSITSYNSSYTKNYRERSLSYSNLRKSKSPKSINSTKPVIKKEKINTLNELIQSFLRPFPIDRYSNIRVSTLPLKKIYRNNSPYSELFTWNNLFTYRNLQNNIHSSRESYNDKNIILSTQKLKRQNKSSINFLSDQKVPHNIKKSNELGEYLINKKNKMLKEILSKNKINYDIEEKSTQYDKYGNLPFKRKLNYLIQKKKKTKE